MVLKWLKDKDGNWWWIRVQIWFIHTDLKMYIKYMMDLRSKMLLNVIGISFDQIIIAYISKFEFDIKVF